LLYFFQRCNIATLFDGLKVKRFTLLSIVLPNYFSKIFHQKHNPLIINKKARQLLQLPGFFTPP